MYEYYYIQTPFGELKVEVSFKYNFGPSKYGIVRLYLDESCLIDAEWNEDLFTTPMSVLIEKSEAGSHPVFEYLLDQDIYCDIPWKALLS